MKKEKEIKDIQEAIQVINNIAEIINTLAREKEAQEDFNKSIETTKQKESYGN